MTFENQPSVPPPLEPIDPLPSTPPHRLFFQSRLLRALILSVLCLILGAITFNWAMEAFLHSRDEVFVPQVVGKTVNEGLEILSKSGLTLTQESVEYNESLPSGAILRQKPASGMKVRRGRSIRVVISKGGQSLFVPDISGKSVSDAQTAISGAGLSLGEVAEVYSILVARGLVVEQVPKAGDTAAKGSLVDLKISKGNPPDNVKLMPDFRNKSIEEVRTWAKQEGYPLGIQESTSSVALSGLILQQDPMPDQPLQAGMMIRVVASPVRQESASTTRLRYEVPKGTEKVQVRMVARDEQGEHEIFKGEQNPGDVLNVPMNPTGPTRVRIFLNDVLVDEQIVEPGSAPSSSLPQTN